MNIKTLFRVLQAKWRLYFGFCPECNSSAPEIDSCYVCDGYRTPYPPSKETKTEWLRRYSEPGIRLAGGKRQAKELGNLIKTQRAKRQH